MKTFRVSGDLRFAFTIEVQAESPEEAEELVSEMNPKDIERQGNVAKERASIGIEIDGSEEA